MDTGYTPPSNNAQVLESGSGSTGLTLNQDAPRSQDSTFEQRMESAPAELPSSIESAAPVHTAGYMRNDAVGEIMNSNVYRANPNSARAQGAMAYAKIDATAQYINESGGIKGAIKNLPKAYANDLRSGGGAARAEKAEAQSNAQYAAAYQGAAQGTADTLQKIIDGASDSDVSNDAYLARKIVEKEE